MFLEALTLVFLETLTLGEINPCVFNPFVSGLALYNDSFIYEQEAVHGACIQHGSHSPDSLTHVLLGSHLVIKDGPKA